MVDHLHFQLRNIINGANCFVINCQRREACRATQRAIVCSVSWNPRSKLLRNFVTETCSRCQTRPLSRKEAARAVTGAAALWSRVWGESWFFSFGSRWLRPSDRERIQLKSEKRALVLGLSLVEKKKKDWKKMAVIWGGTLWKFLMRRIGLHLTLNPAAEEKSVILGFKTDLDY